LKSGAEARLASPLPRRGTAPAVAGDGGGIPRGIADGKTYIEGSSRPADANKKN
jgi:hypothetical protein